MKHINCTKGIFLKSLILTLIFTACSHNEKVVQKWSISENIKNPESIYFDSTERLIYVSNIDGDGVKKDKKGHISLFTSQGVLINSHWVKELNAPKGMRSHKGKLWVTDIDQVLKIDQKSGRIETKYIIPNAKFLNDIAIDSKGIVYVSDTITSKIHKINGHLVTTFVSGKKYDSPNGLLVYGDKLIVAAWGLTTDWSSKKQGRLYSIDLGTKSISYISKSPLGNLDGLELNKDGKFLVSDWVAGKLFEVDMQGNSKTLFTGKKGLADIGYDIKTNRIFIPYMLDNKIFEL